MDSNACDDSSTLLAHSLLVSCSLPLPAHFPTLAPKPPPSTSLLPCHPSLGHKEILPLLDYGSQSVAAPRANKQSLYQDSRSREKWPPSTWAHRSPGYLPIAARLQASALRGEHRKCLNPQGWMLKAHSV